jgi:hypothetical protein
VNAFLRRFAAAVVVLASSSLAAGAQAVAAPGRDFDPGSYLDATSRYAIDLVIDSARVAGLPVAPLESKAREGIAKRVDGRRIVVAVRGVFHSLRDARAALGAGASPDELEAAAGVLRVGVPAAEVARLSHSRHEKQLTVPLVVLADLVTRGVPRDTASQTILQLWQHGAADEDFLGLWRGVERDIVSGTAPGAALLNRAREIPSRGPPPATPPTPAAGGPPPEKSETQNN